ncbi:MAG: TIGR00268 family protein [candidate division Zixibacteria bacterium CG_4_9_14_3_um_filter_46_8]|nr:MAG: TIGR00268 family protein [candidate division Zixibacteria bacterium CG_4_9_14_3_um_filter_46_8]
MADSLDRKLENIFLSLQGMQSVVVAFSGGVDSTFLLWVALQALGKEKVLAATGISASLMPREREEARQLAQILGANWEEINTDEMAVEGYRQNSPDRCMFCKGELYQKLNELAVRRGFANVIDGTNAEEADGHRPGLKALAKSGIPSPLKDAGMTKSEIRELSKRAGLPTWNKPAIACLASRIPYGSEVTEEKLKRIGAAEEFLLQIGFRQLRVRDHFPVARIEIEPDDMSIIFTGNNRIKIDAHLKGLGYKFVTLDLAGFKSGSMNILIDKGKA